MTDSKINIERIERGFWETLYPREKWTPSEWAERAPRKIPDNGINPEPGSWRNSRTPYLVEILDTLVAPGIQEVGFLKPTQVGYTDGVIVNAIGYWIDLDPGACMLVEPDEQLAKEVLDERVLPTIRETPALNRHLSARPWDTKTTKISLDTMPVFVGWAGSPTRMASRSIRYLLLDEVDKYPVFSGKEADPISLARQRVSNWKHRARIVIGSTPTTRAGHIWRWWESCPDRRRYWVPCPHCGKHQVLVFSRVLWPKMEQLDRPKRADKIKTDKLAWYQCEHCDGRIFDHHKPAMLSQGAWASDGQEVVDGEVRGERPRSSRVGFHLSSLYSPWVDFSEVAAAFVLASDDPAMLMNFRNSMLAEPFEEQASKTEASLIEQKRVHAGPPLEVPAWAPLVLATADVQKDRLYYVIRAWGHQYRSQLVAYGMARDFGELEQIVFERPLAGPEGSQIVPSALAIDCKYRTDEVYAFAQRRPGEIYPSAGSSNVKAAPITEKHVKGYDGVIRRTVNPNYWKSVLHNLMHDDDETKWLPHAQVGDDYIQHMRSEHQILDRRSGLYVWVPVSSGAPNHTWDCEYHQVWLAQSCGAAAIPPANELEQMRAQRRRQQASAEDSDDRSSWRGRGGGNWATNYKRRW